jgi:hypothetical protein
LVDELQRAAALVEQRDQTRRAEKHYAWLDYERLRGVMASTEANVRKAEAAVGGR